MKKKPLSKQNSEKPGGKRINTVISDVFCCWSVFLKLVFIFNALSEASIS